MKETRTTFESMPPCCPICGSAIVRDRQWDGKHTRQLGWRCLNPDGGLSHFLQAKAGRIRTNQESYPWLFPPVDGYPGLRRDEISDPEYLNECLDRFYQNSTSKKTQSKHGDSHEQET